MSSREYTQLIFEDYENSELFGFPIICMKNMKKTQNKFAVITEDSMISKDIVLVHRKSKSETIFNNITDMLDDGWVID